MSDSPLQSLLKGGYEGPPNDQLPGKPEKVSPLQSLLRGEQINSPTAFFGSKPQTKRPVQDDDSFGENILEGLEIGWKKHLAGGGGHMAGSVLSDIGFDDTGDSIKKWADDYAKTAPEHDDSWGQFIGSIIPSSAVTAGAIAATIATKGAAAPYVTPAAMGALGLSSAGSGMKEYEEYKKAIGEPITMSGKYAVALAYGVAEAAAERFGLKRLMPPALKGAILKGNVKLAEKSGKKLLADYAKEQPRKAAQIMKRVALAGNLEGFQEAITEAAQDITDRTYKLEEHTPTWQQAVKNMAKAYGAGALMGAGIGPLSFAAQNQAIRLNREKQGFVAIGRAPNGEAVEITGESGDSYNVMYPSGEQEKFAKSEITETYKFSPGQFDTMLKDAYQGQLTEERVQAEQANQEIEQSNSILDQIGKSYGTVRDGIMTMELGKRGDETVIIGPVDQSNPNLRYIYSTQGPQMVKASDLKDIEVVPVEEMKKPPIDVSQVKPLQVGEKTDAGTVAGINKSSGQASIIVDNEGKKEYITMPIENAMAIRVQEEVSQEPVFTEEENIDPASQPDNVVVPVEEVETTINKKKVKLLNSGKEVEAQTGQKMTEEEAEKLATELNKKYPHQQFNIVDNTPEGALAEADFKIISNGKTKKTEDDSRAEPVADRDESEKSDDKRVHTKAGKEIKNDRQGTSNIPPATDKGAPDADKEVLESNVRGREDQRQSGPGKIQGEGQEAKAQEGQTEKKKKAEEEKTVKTDDTRPTKKEEPSPMLRNSDRGTTRKDEAAGGTARNDRDNREKGDDGKQKKIDPAKLQDVGEKIGGAKKDLFQSLEKITTGDIESQPLSKVFPEPDYKKLTEDGLLTTDAAIFLKFFYKSIPAKPRKKYRVAGWVNKVQGAIDVYKDLINAPKSKQEELVKRVNSLSHLQGQYDMFSQTMKGLGFPQNDYNLGKFEIRKFEGMMKKGKDIGARYTIINGNSIIEDFNSMDEAIQGLKSIISQPKASKPKVKFSVFQDRTTKDIFIGKRGATETVRLVEGFKTSKEAREHLENHQAELESQWESMKVKTSERRDTNRKRKGADWRQGKDITSEEFAETFGFRGVEFGNWVNNKERQGHVNDAYDALMDLSNVVGVNPRALSLNGELGFAFGARGSGSANAHYEPGKVVINLTKKRGAGSLAHEWWHALDNYFSRKRDIKTGYITDSPRQRMNRDGSKDERVRLEMIEAFKGVVDAIKGTKLSKRSAQLDKTRSKPYWSTMVEMSARSFESFIIHKLGEQGQQNDYLANFKEVTEWINDTKGNIDVKNNYPYLLKDEVHTVHEAYNQFFNNIEEEQNPDGSILVKEHIDIAYGSEEKHREAIETIVEDQINIQFSETDMSRDRVSESTTEGDDLPSDRGYYSIRDIQQRTVLRDFQESGHVNLLGRQVKSPVDIADLYQIYRSPYIEKFHVIYVNEGIILGDTALTFGHINTAPAPDNNFIRRGMDHYGATEFYVLHNHPSGNHQVSDADIMATETMAEGFRESFKGHVVINADKFSLINSDSNVSEHSYTPKEGLGQLLSNRYKLGSGIKAQEQMAKVAEQLLKRDSSVGAVVYLAHNNDIAAYDPIIEGQEPREVIQQAFKGLRNNLGAKVIFVQKKGAINLRESGVMMPGETADFFEVEGEGSNTKATSLPIMPGASVEKQKINHPQRLWEQPYEYGTPYLNSPQFKRWFKNSKVVDKQGNPLVTYHGTNNNFNVFNRERLGESTGFESAKYGFYFTARKDVAEAYSQGMFSIPHNKSSVVMPAYLSLQNPLVAEDVNEKSRVDALKKATSGNYDGVIFTEGGEPSTFVAFDNKQIKSIYNVGSFETANEDIRLMRVGINADLEAMGINGQTLRENLTEAQKLTEQGVSADRIKLATGWEVDPLDNKWKYQISDKGMKLKNFKPQGRMFLNNVIEHKKLFELYPEFEYIDVEFKDLGNDTFAQFSPTEFKIYLNPKKLPSKNDSGEAGMDTALQRKGDQGPRKPDTKGTGLQQGEGHNDAERRILGKLAHEIQHAVQDNERFNLGTNPNKVRDKLIKDGKLDKKYQNTDYGKLPKDERALIFQAYLRVAGEAEARDTEQKIGLTEEELSREPFLSKDKVNPNDLFTVDGDDIVSNLDFPKLKRDFSDAAVLGQAVTENPALAASVVSNPQIRERKLGAVNQMVEEIKLANPWLPNVNVYESMLDFRMKYGVNIEGANQVPGLFYRNQSHIIASHWTNGNKENIQKTIFHEVIGHEGLRGFVNEVAVKKGTDFRGELNGLLDQVYESYKDDTRLHDLIPLYANGKKAGDKLTKEEQRLVAEEFIAHEAERGITNDIFEKIYAFLRKLYRTVFDSEFELDDIEIREILAASRGYIKRKGRYSKMPNALRNKTVYHGSGNDFDFFSSDFVGTGRKRTKFGWGLYFSTEKSAAGLYANLTSKRELIKRADATPTGLTIEDIENLLQDYSKKDLITTIENLKKPFIGKAKIEVGNKEKPIHKKELISFIKDHVKGQEVIYEVDMKGSSWMDWYEPVKNLKAINDLGYNFEKGTTGETVFKTLEEELGSKGASLKLLEAGIHGTKFPVGGIYGQREYDGSGANYVVFDENMIAINHKEVIRYKRTQAYPMEDPESYENVLEPNPTVAPTQFGKITAWWDKQLIAFQDSKLPIKQLQRKIAEDGGIITDKTDVYGLDDTAHGKIKGLIDKFRKDLMAPLMGHIKKIAKSHNMTFNDVERYLKAKHAPEVNARFNKIKGTEGMQYSGFTDEQANQLVKDFEGKVSKEDVDKLWGHIKAITQDINNKRLEAGLISEKRYKELQTNYEWYVPLRGWADQADVDPTLYSKDFRQQGRTSESGSPISYLVAMENEAIVKGENNKVKKAMLDLMIANPDPQLYSIKNVHYTKTGDVVDGKTEWQVSFGKAPKDAKTTLDGEVDTITGDKFSEDKVTVMVDGSPVVMAFNDGRVGKAIKNAEQANSNAFVSVFRKYNRFLASMYTQYSPEFAARNFIRDSFTGAINIGIDRGGKASAAVLKGVPSSINTLRNYFFKGKVTDPMFQEFIDSGGMIGISDISRVSDTTKGLEREVERAKKSPNGLTMSREGLEKVLENISNANRVLENSIRFSAYKYLRSKGVSAHKAAIEVKNLTVNFNRKGDLSSTIGAFYLFFNASVQGSARLAEPFHILKSLTGKKLTKQEKLQQRNALAVAATLPIFTYVLHSMARMLGGEDEDGEYYYDKLTEYEKNTHLILPSPTEGKFIKVPMPYGYNVFTGAGNLMVDMVNGRAHAKDSALQLITLFSSSFSPLGGIDFSQGRTGEQLVKMAVPTLLKPGVDITYNTNFMGIPIMPEEYVRGQFDGKPDSSIFFDSVNPIIHEFTKQLNRWTGGDEVLPGIVDWSPENIEHLLTSYGGGAFSILNDLYTTSSLVAKGVNPIGHPEYNSKIPFIGNYLATPNAWVNTQQFYDLAGEVEAKNKVFEEYKKIDRRKAAEYRRENFQYIRALPLVKQYKKRLKAINQKIDQYETNPEAAERLEEQEDRILKEFHLRMKRILHGTD
jgi:hypothetical protein